MNFSLFNSVCSVYFVFEVCIVHCKIYSVQCASCSVISRAKVCIAPELCGAKSALLHKYIQEINKYSKKWEFLIYLKCFFFYVTVISKIYSSIVTTFKEKNKLQDGTFNSAPSPAPAIYFPLSIPRSYSRILVCSFPVQRKYWRAMIGVRIVTSRAQATEK